MTKAEAAVLRGKWKQRRLSKAQELDAPAREHPHQELEASESGYLTSNYHGTDCGETVAKKL
jgi:hypothetical protein